MATVIEAPETIKHKLMHVCTLFHGVSPKSTFSLLFLDYEIDCVLCVFFLTNIKELCHRHNVQHQRLAFQLELLEFRKLSGLDIIGSWLGSEVSAFVGEGDHGVVGGGQDRTLVV